MTIAALMHDPALHYHSKTVVVVDGVGASVGLSEIHLGMPTASTSGLQSNDSSPRTWGPRIADEDIEEVIRQLYHAQGLQIKGHLIS